MDLNSHSFGASSQLSDPAACFLGGAFITEFSLLQKDHCMVGAKKVLGNEASDSQSQSEPAGCLLPWGRIHSAGGLSPAAKLSQVETE
jgi:hypothetical protein